MQSVRAEVERIQPDFLIIDSIQTIMSLKFQGCRGQFLRCEVTAELMQLAKTNNIAIFIVGHVWPKEGTLAGASDAGAYGGYGALLWRRTPPHLPNPESRQNRFGSTNEIGIFEMQSGGLVEVLNP